LPAATDEADHQPQHAADQGDLEQRGEHPAAGGAPAAAEEMTDQPAGDEPAEQPARKAAEPAARPRRLVLAEAGIVAGRLLRRGARGHRAIDRRDIARRILGLARRGIGARAAAAETAAAARVGRGDGHAGQAQHQHRQGQRAGRLLGHGISPWCTDIVE